MKPPSTPVPRNARASRMPVAEPSDHQPEQERSDDVDAQRHRRHDERSACRRPSGTAREQLAERDADHAAHDHGTEHARTDGRSARHGTTLCRRGTAGSPPRVRPERRSAAASARPAGAGSRTPATRPGRAARRARTPRRPAGRCSCRAPPPACCPARLPSPEPRARSARLRSFGGVDRADPRERLRGEDRATQRAEVLRREGAAGQGAHVRVDVCGRERHAAAAAPVRQERRSRPARARAPP